MSDLVGNPKDRFSHIAAHFIIPSYNCCVPSQCKLCVGHIETMSACGNVVFFSGYSYFTPHTDRLAL